MEANTCKNADIPMPNYVLSKAATPMSSHFERALFTSKFFADFVMQNPFKVGTERTARNVPVPIVCTFCFEKTMHGKIDASY